MRHHLTWSFPLLLGAVALAQSASDSPAPRPTASVPPTTADRTEGMDRTPGTMRQHFWMMMHTRITPSDPSALLAMDDQLKLTPDQVKQLLVLADDTREKAKALLTDAQRKQLDALPQTPTTPMDMHLQMMMRMMHNGGMHDHETHGEGMHHQDMDDHMGEHSRGEHADRMGGGMMGRETPSPAPTTQPSSPPAGTR